MTLELGKLKIEEKKNRKELKIEMYVNMLNLMYYVVCMYMLYVCSIAIVESN